MAFNLNFAQLVVYDAGLPGITLEISLRMLKVSVDLAAKIDTGSSHCIFAREYGEQLGLDIENGELVRIGTATGVFKTYRHDVTLSVLDYEFDARVCFAEDLGFNHNVLGRRGFLDRVILGLNDYEGKLYLNKYE